MVLTELQAREKAQADIRALVVASGNIDLLFASLLSYDLLWNYFNAMTKSLRQPLSSPSQLKQLAALADAGIVKCLICLLIDFGPLAHEEQLGAILSVESVSSVSNGYRIKGILVSVI